MKIKFRPIYFLSIILCLFILSICGCAARNPGQPGRNQAQQQQYFQQAPQGMKLVTEVSDGQRADNIRNHLAGTPGVDRVNAVVYRDTAVIGLLSAGTLKNAEALKNNIVTRVRNIDRSITRVYVSDSPDIIAQIGHLSDDIANNRSVNSIPDRFNKLIEGLNSKPR